MMILSIGNANRIDDAFKEMYEGKYEKAIKIFSKISKSKGEDAALSYFYMGIIEYKRKNVEQYSINFQNAALLNPQIAFGRMVSIPIESMSPILEKGDCLLIDDQYYKYNIVKRNDIVKFVSPIDNKTEYVSRIKGIGRDKVKIIDGKVYINGKLVDNATTIFIDDIDITLNEDEYFLIGDNLKASLDSRSFGPVNEKKILGKVIAIYGSVNSKDGNPFNSPRAGIILN